MEKKTTNTILILLFLSIFFGLIGFHIDGIIFNGYLFIFTYLFFILPFIIKIIINQEKIISTLEKLEAEKGNIE